MRQLPSLLENSQNSLKLAIPQHHCGMLLVQAIPVCLSPGSGTMSFGLFVCLFLQRPMVPVFLATSLTSAVALWVMTSDITGTHMVILCTLWTQVWMRALKRNLCTRASLTASEVSMSASSVLSCSAFYSFTGCSMGSWDWDPLFCQIWV